MFGALRRHGPALSRDLIWVAVLSVGILLAGVALTGATTQVTRSASLLVNYDLAGLARDAEVAVLAEVTGQSARPVNGPEAVVTETVLRTLDTYKGDARKSWLVTTRGGVLSDRFSVAEDQARFRIGDLVLVFLVHSGSKLGTTTLGGYQGRYYVVNGIATNERETRSMRDVARVFGR